MGFYEAWWRDADLSGECAAGLAEVSLSVSPSEWTAPVAVGAPVDVHVSTCAAAVDLFVNGERQGAAPQPVPRLAFALWPQVAFAPGNLTAVAYDAGGAVVATRTLLSSGAAFALHAWVEDVYNAPRNGSAIAADGQDAALIGVAVRDSSGALVPNADVTVTFSIAGPAALVGLANGDPAAHTPHGGAAVATWKGLARAIVASSAPGAVGGIVVTAAAPGLQPASVRLVAA